MSRITIQSPLTRWHTAWPQYRQDIREVARETLHAARAPVKTALTIALPGDERVRRLNRDFRHHDKATNVLAFPGDGPDYAGDVILAFETVRREASEQRKPFMHHALHLVVHGVLHLLHYDHDTAENALRMETLEREILARRSIPDPYAETIGIAAPSPIYA